MAPLATPNNLHPCTLANGFQRGTKMQRQKGWESTRLWPSDGLLRCATPPWLSASAWIADGRFTTRPSRTRNSGSHRDLFIKTRRGPWLFTLPKRPTLAILLKASLSILRDVQNPSLEWYCFFLLIKGILTLPSWFTPQTAVIIIWPVESPFQCGLICNSYLRLEQSAMYNFLPLLLTFQKFLSLYSVRWIEGLSNNT